MRRRQRRSTLFPYTTLFRSGLTAILPAARVASWRKRRRRLRRGLCAQSGYDLRASSDRCPERSEEHTSELQSRQYLACRLLLETKPNTATPPRSTPSSLPLA